MSNPAINQMDYLLGEDGQPWYLPDDLFQKLTVWLATKPKVRRSLHELKYGSAVIDQEERRLHQLKMLCEYNRLQRQPLPTNALNQAFASQALTRISDRARQAAERGTAELQAVLILPEGKFIRIPSDPGLPAPQVQTSTEQPARPFGDRTIHGALPPTRLLPRRRPLTAVEISAGGSCLPDRIHLLYGRQERLSRFRDIAEQVAELRRAVDLPRHLFCCRRSETSADDRVLDEWLCTLHWWMWLIKGLPIAVTPQTVFNGDQLSVLPDSKPYFEREVFSILPWDLLRVSTVVAAHLSVLLNGGAGCGADHLQLLATPPRPKNDEGNQHSPKESPDESQRDGIPLLELLSRSVRYDDTSIPLKRKQLLILKVLIASPDKPVTSLILANKIGHDPRLKRALSQAVSLLRVALRPVSPLQDPVTTSGRKDSLAWTLTLPFQLKIASASTRSSKKIR